MIGVPALRTVADDADGADGVLGVLVVGLAVGLWGGGAVVLRLVGGREPSGR